MLERQCTEKDAIRNKNSKRNLIEKYNSILNLYPYYNRP